MLHDVDGRVDRIAHRLRVGLVLCGDVEGRAVVGRGPDGRKSRREVHPVGRQGLERRQSLVVVHGQDAVVLGVSASGEKPVGGKRPESQHALAERLDDGRADDLLLLAPQQSAVAGVRVEGHDGDARLDDAEVLDERTAQRVEVPHDPLFGDVAGDLRNGNVLGDQPHAQRVAAQDHHGLAFEFGGQVLGVPRVAEVVRLHGLLVEGCGHERVEVSRLQVAHGGAQRLDGGASRLGSRLARHDFGVFPACHEVRLSAARLGGRCHGVEGEGFDLCDGISVIGRGFGRAVDDGREKLRHPRVGERLEDDLPADAVRVALRDAYFEFVFWHNQFYFNLQSYKIFRIHNASDSIKMNFYPSLSRECNFLLSLLQQSVRIADIFWIKSASAFFLPPKIGHFRVT